jgi:LysM repeat protein
MIRRAIYQAVPTAVLFLATVAIMVPLMNGASQASPAPARVALVTHYRVMATCDGDRDADDSRCGMSAARPVAVHSSLYRVRPGDTLSGIAARYHTSWEQLWALNRGLIGNPDLIRVGWVLRTSGRASVAVVASRPASRPATGLSGTLSYAGLEALWESVGGARWAAPTAACIAEHESGGRQYAIGAAGEKGYWQIHPVHGALSSYVPSVNARAAVILSGNGRSWAAWTTHVYCGV